MVGGFTFNGIDINDLGLEYAPDNANTYVYRPSQWLNHEEVFAGRNGGYFYGATTKPKEFTLRCFYEAKHVKLGIMTNLFEVFRKNKFGRLVFKQRPWIWYNATVTDVDISQMFSYLNGFVTIRLKAYYPFGRCEFMSLDKASSLTAEEKEDVRKNSSIILKYAPRTNFTMSGNAAQHFYLFNPGTETADVGILIAGTASQITIANRTTEELCSYIGITAAETSSVSKYIYTDSISGETLLTNGTTYENAYKYHEYGYITLAPNKIYTRLKNLKVTSGSTTVTFSLIKDISDLSILKGKFIPITSGGTYAQITAITKTSATISTTPSAAFSPTEEICVIDMNDIYVTPDGTVTISKLNFKYYPTFM